MIETSSESQINELKAQIQSNETTYTSLKDLNQNLTIKVEEYKAKGTH